MKPLLPDMEKIQSETKVTPVIKSSEKIHPKTGELLVEEGLIHPETIDQVLAIQNKAASFLSTRPHRFFGVILCNLNLITPLDNFSILKKHNKLMTLKDALVSQTKIPEKSVNQVFLEVHKTNLSIFDLLLAQRLITKSRLQELIFSLYHIPFRTLEQLTFNHKQKSALCRIISQTESMHGRILPLAKKDDTLLIGTTDPENLIHVKKLHERFPQFRFKCVFISFKDFTRIHEKFYNQILEKSFVTEKKTVHQHTGTPPDLSLLKNYSVVIHDPAGQQETIKELYKRYEALRLLTGASKRESLIHEFNRFIMESHARISRDYQTNRIKFSLNQDGQGVGLAAEPLPVHNGNQPLKGR